MKKQTIFTLLFVLVALLTMILMTNGTFMDTSLERAQKNGVIRIGYAVEAPYIFLNPNGEVTGAEAETARKVVQRLGIEKIEWNLYEFNNLIFELEAGRVDVVVAGMFITPERALRVNFSEPTFHALQGLLVLAGNPRRLVSYRQAASQPDVKIAVISGSVEEGIFQSLVTSEERIIQVPDARTGKIAVETGVADGLALSALSIRWMAQQQQLGGTEMAQAFEQTNLSWNTYFGYGGMAFRKRDLQLHAAWNRELKMLVGTEEHLALIEPFGFSVKELPGAMTTQEIISNP